MIKIRIRNDDHEIDVQFPISENKLYAKLAEIHAIEGKDAPQSAFVTEVYWPEELSMLKDRFANLDELNYLARRMESFDYHEYDHLLLTLNEQNSLADANMLAFMVDNAKPDFRSKLEQNLLHDQYDSMQEVTDAIKQMLYESGPVKAVFYCPLVGEVTDDEGFSSPVDGRFLKSYAWAVENALEADTADDEMDMAEFFDEDDGVKAKLVSAKWGVEPYRGRLFGRIECCLKEELTGAETEILIDWISGQNSDGYGEHFEQQPIDTEDVDLYVSFWNSGDNYSIMTHDELDVYIDNQGMTMGGM